MKIGEVKIGGKSVKVIYCYATEIAFAKSAGVGMDQFDGRNPEHVVCLLLAAMTAYGQWKGEKVGVKDVDVMFGAKPAELLEAVRVVMELQREWYEVPAGEGEELPQNGDKDDEDGQKGGTEKNG